MNEITPNQAGNEPQGGNAGGEPQATPNQPTQTPTQEPSATAPQAPAEPQAQGGQQPTEDYKQKFAASTTENQRLLGLLQKAGIDPKTGAVSEPSPVRSDPVPTQPEAVPAPAALEALPEDLRTALLQIPQNAKTVEGMRQLVAEMHDKQKYADDYGNLVKNDAYKGIVQYADEFREFAYKQENLQTPLEVLAQSFLFAKGQQPAPAQPQAPAPQGMEPGSAGAKAVGRVVDGKTELTSAEARQLRKTDPRAYNKLAKDGKITITDE